MSKSPEQPSLLEESGEEDRALAQFGVLTRRIKLLRRRLFMERVVFVTLILALLVVILILRRPLPAWVISVNGEPVIAVADRQTAESLLDKIKREQAPILSETGPLSLAQADFQEAVAITRVKAKDHQVVSADQARGKLGRLLNTVIPAYAILVDGKLAVALPTEADATRCLSRVKARSAPETARLESPPRFKESVSIRKREVPANQLKAKIDQAVKVLLQGGSRTTTYRVRKGDTAWIIAHNHGIGVPDLQKLNPQTDLKRLHGGDKLVVGAVRPQLTVVTREKRTWSELIDFPTESTETEDLPRGTRRVVQPGEPGKREVEVVVTLENGRVVEREKASYQVLKEPVPRKVLIGTKVTPSPAHPSETPR